MSPAARSPASQQARPEALCMTGSHGAGARSCMRSLSILPQLDLDERRIAAVRYLATIAADMGQAARDALVDEAFSLLDDPVYAGIFSDASQAELSIAGYVTLAGEERAVLGPD